MVSIDHSYMKSYTNPLLNP